MWPWISQWTWILCRKNPSYHENSFICFACSPVVRQASVASVYNLALMLLKNSAKITTSVSFCFICFFFYNCAFIMCRLHTAQYWQQPPSINLIWVTVIVANSIQLTGDFRDFICAGDANKTRVLVLFKQPSFFELCFSDIIMSRLIWVSSWEILSARVGSAGAKNDMRKSDFSLFLARQNFLRTRSSEPVRRLVMQ